MIERRKGSGWLHDERGSKSMGRLLLTLELLYLWALGYLDAARGTAFDVPGPVWALHASLVLALVGWVGGPRIMQHIGPQIAGAAQGVAAAVRQRLERTDNRFRDDERGDA